MTWLAGQTKGKSVPSSHMQLRGGVFSDRRRSERRLVQAWEEMGMAEEASAASSALQPIPHGASRFCTSNLAGVALSIPTKVAGDSHGAGEQMFGIPFWHCSIVGWAAWLGLGCHLAAPSEIVQVWIAFLKGYFLTLYLRIKMSHKNTPHVFFQG